MSILSGGSSFHWNSLTQCACNLLDRNTGSAGFLGNRIVLLLNGSPGGLIAFEPTQKSARDAPVRTAGAILVDNVEQGIAALNGL
jgi:hypothetical protein